jgi:HTH-type transcriptional regulator, global nitrogen regulator NrpRI
MRQEGAAVSTEHGRDEVRQAIMRALQESPGPAGAEQICDVLTAAGLRIQPRTVRLRLLELDRAGLTELVSRRAGRTITERGRRELQRNNVMEKAGVVAARMDALICGMTYDLERAAGTIVVNRSRIPRSSLARAMEDMRPVFTRRMSMGDRVAIVDSGARSEHAVIVTVCSITVNGVLLKEGVPVASRFGGLLEMEEGKPYRFTELIEYRGSTLDPIEVFIQARMTGVRQCARSGCGVIAVSFREFPSVALPQVQHVRAHLARAGLDGILMIGQPGRPLLGIPVSESRTGMIVAGGLNPVAALQESGVPVELNSLAGMEEYASLAPFEDLRNRWPG